MRKVKIQDGIILQDGVAVGTVYGSGGEWYVHAGTDNRTKLFLARFKRSLPGKSAKTWVQHVFARHTVEEMLAGIKKTSPLEFAEATGYELPHIIEWRARGLLPATYEAGRATRREQIQARLAA